MNFRIPIVFTILFLMGLITFKNSISFIGSKLNLLSSVANEIDDFSEEEEDKKEEEKEKEKSEKEFKFLSADALEDLHFILLQKEKYSITKEFQVPDIIIVPETPPPSLV